MNRQYNALVFAILSTVALFAGSGLTYWQFLKRSDQAKTVSELRRDLKGEAKIRTELEQTTAKLADSTQKLDHLEQGVPPAAYVPTMMTELEVVGTECGVRVTGVRPKEESKAAQSKDDSKKASKSRKDFAEQTLEVKGLGSFRSAMKFISAMESFPKIVSVHAVSLVPKKERDADANSMTLEMTVEIRAYVFPPSDSAATTKTALASPTRGTLNETG